MDFAPAFWKSLLNPNELEFEDLKFYLDQNTYENYHSLKKVKLKYYCEFEIFFIL